MTIKEIYYELTKKELTLADFKTIVDLKNQCVIEMNQEYLYLCDILIIDIYINENLFDDALNITIKNINNIDSIIFKKIYISFLDRAIYIFIQKKNYKSAYRYAFMKRKVIDLDNIDEINRWYLEMAYIYAELNQKEKALMNLKAILNNYPNDGLKALTLSNMTKLYIDQKQISEAKSTLNECITLVYKLDDEEGITYCEYLNAKLHILENNLKLAKQSFQDIFKNLNNLTDDYLSIANEYIALLIDMDLYDEAYRISIKYLKSVEKSKDLYIKKNYYKNYLKIFILKNKNVREDLKQLLHAIEVLETEIDRTGQNIINESNEDDKNLEVATQIREVIGRIEKTINITNLALKNENERDCFMEFSKGLESYVYFDEILFVILTKGDSEVLPDFLDNFNIVKTYNYKKQRLYERDFSFNNLTGTVIEMLLSTSHEVALDFKETPIPVKDLVTEKSYAELGVKSLYAIPLNMEREIFGCVIFVGDDSTLIDQEQTLNLKVATKLLELKLINLFFQENLRSQKAIMQVAIEDLEAGIYFLNPENRKMMLSEELSNFFQKSSNLTKEEYEDNINPEDLKIYENIEKFIEMGEPYKIEYRIKIGEKEVLISDKAHPYITKDGIIKFYVGTIAKLDNEIIVNEVENEAILGAEDYQKTLSEISEKTHNLEYKCTFVKFVLENTDGLKMNKFEKVVEYVYGVIKENFSNQVYYLDNGFFAAILEINDQRVIDRKVKAVFSIIDQGIIYENEALHFDLKAAAVRFPRDTYNFQEVSDFLEIALNSENRYQIFNDDLHKRFLKKKAITACVKEELKRDNLELLFLKLKTKDNTTAYEVTYNIPGLTLKEPIFEYLDFKERVPLEKLVVKTLFKKLDSKKEARY
ncbi:MAG: PAS domain-containing protein, partial [Bacilli bacterium]|nr:PAS domain-containing protein [Bacilli bacterium]